MARARRYLSRRVARDRRYRAPQSPPPRPRPRRRVARARRHRAPASAGPPGGSRLQSSRTPVAASPVSAGPAAPAVVPVACLEPHRDFEIGQWLVTAWADVALVSRVVQEERGKYIPPPKF